MTIPTIDISPFLTGGGARRAEVVKQWSSAFETIGFATIIGHSIQETLIENLHDEAQLFFDQRPEVKRQYSQAADADTQGYVGLGAEALARTFDGDARPAPADYSERLTFNYIDWERAGTSNEFDRRVLRPNVWPSERPRLRALAEAYFDEVYRLANLLTRIGALALDLPEDFFVTYYTRMTTQLSFVYYPDQTTEPLPGQLRSGAHVDYLGFTILRQDDAPGGLQVRLEDDNWVDVTPVPHAFVVNLGELLSRWTNDRWKANVHRVVNPPRDLDRSARRLSIAFFTGPNHDAIIECLPTCRIGDAPPKYPPIRAWDHFIDKVNASKVSGRY